MLTPFLEKDSSPFSRSRHTPITSPDAQGLHSFTMQPWAIVCGARVVPMLLSLARPTPQAPRGQQCERQQSSCGKHNRCVNQGHSRAVRSVVDVPALHALAVPSV